MSLASSMARILALAVVVRRATSAVVVAGSSEDSDNNDNDCKAAAPAPLTDSWLLLSRLMLTNEIMTPSRNVSCCRSCDSEDRRWSDFDDAFNAAAMKEDDMADTAASVAVVITDTSLFLEIRSSDRGDSLESDSSGDMCRNWSSSSPLSSITSSSWLDGMLRSDSLRCCLRWSWCESKDCVLLLLPSSSSPADSKSSSYSVIFSS